MNIEKILTLATNSPNVTAIIFLVICLCYTERIYQHSLDKKNKRTKDE